MRPSAEYLAECFSYEPETGILTWKERPDSHFSAPKFRKAFNTKSAGKEAGTLDRNGYLVLRLAGSTHRVHRIIWALVYGQWPTIIDHIDRDKLNNKISNLREVDARTNCRNKSVQKNNKTTGVLGVSKSDSWGGKYGARITDQDGKVVWLGLHESLEAAAAARQAAEIKYGYGVANG